MITYKNMTFCQESNCKKFNGCPRALTGQVREDAEKWWGSKGAPISVFLDRLECYEKGNTWLYGCDKCRRSVFSDEDTHRCEICGTTWTDKKIETEAGWVDI